MTIQKTPALPLYFDNHATTPVDPRVVDVMMDYLTRHFGNAESSQHAYGWKAKAAIEQARAEVASLIGAEPAEIVFTSGATESIHLAILGHLEEQGAGRHIVTANAEHKATLEVCARAQKFGHEVTLLEVDAQARVNRDQVLEALRTNTSIVSLMHGNNEVGSLHPIQEIGGALSERGVIFHVDAAQTAGKHPIDVKAMGIGLLSLSAHKLYGPKGVGALYVSKTPLHKTPKVRLAPYLVGGGQEKGLRGGTHNVPGIVGLGAACRIAREEMELERARLTRLRDRLIQDVRAELTGVRLNGHPTERLCNNVSFTIEGVASDSLLLGLHDIAYSSASACSSGMASHVLKAIRGAHSVDPVHSQEFFDASGDGDSNSDSDSNRDSDGDDPFATTLRFGLGRFTRDEDVEYLIRRLIETVRNARAVSRG